MRIIRLFALALAAVLVGGCGAPEKPLRMGFKEVASDVVLGDQTRATAPAPASPDGGPAYFPLPSGIVGLPPPPFEFDPRPSPFTPLGPECPTADPLAAPALEAPSTIERSPVNGQYRFRNNGTYEVSGAHPQRGSFPPTSQRAVTVTFRGENERVFDFTVSERVAFVTTVTTYRVVRGSEIGDAVDGTPEAGIYIRQVESSDTSGGLAVFTPTPELQLAALPLVRGARVETRGVDPTTATTMSFTSTVSGKARVDACGEPLDSFTLELTDGTVLGPRQDLQFAATYAVGTQFGGLVLRDTIAFTGTNGDVGVSRNNTATISEVPT